MCVPLVDLLFGSIFPLMGSEHLRPHALFGPLRMLTTLLNFSPSPPIISQTWTVYSKRLFKCHYPNPYNTIILFFWHIKSHHVVCIFTGPNWMLHYLKVVFHPKYMHVQAMLLLPVHMLLACLLHIFARSYSLLLYSRHSHP